MIVNNNLIKIESFVEQVRGVSYSKKDISDKPKEGFTPVLRSNNIDKGQINFDDLVFLKNSKIKKKQMLRKGDILITASTGSLKVIGKNGFCYKDYKATFGAFCKVVRPIHIYAGYLKHFFQSPQYFSYIQNIVNGANINNIKNEHINNFKIPYPTHISEIQHPKSEIENISLSTQKRIAEILDNAAALRDKTKQLLTEYDQLAQSIFLDMFGDPVTNPKGWEKDKTIDYCDCIVPGRDKPKSFTGDIPWVTTNDLNHLDFTEKSKLGKGLSVEEISQVKAKIIPENSIIITCVGDLGVVSINTKKMVVNQQLHTFQCSDMLNSVFLMFNLSFQKPYMYKMASSTTVPYMNKTIANGIPTIVPPIHLQNQFAEKIALIDQQKDLAKQELQESEDLFQALLQKAFKGELN